jgi:hypothetical protein
MSCKKTLGIKSGLAATSCRCDCLTIGVIDKIATGEDALLIRSC